MMTSSSSPRKSGSGSGGGGGEPNYIQHQVTKFDTLPGVAIRYGVEVADIKKLNGLVSDLQMFARKTLQIPLPGRHPPSPGGSNRQDTLGPSSSDQTPPRNRYPDIFGSFQSLRLKSSPQPRVSPAMNCLLYQGPKSTDRNIASEGFEMAVYQNRVSHSLENGPFVRATPRSSQPPGLYRKCKSVANDMSQNGLGSPENGIDLIFGKLARRRQKSEADFSSRTPEVLLKEDNSSGGTGFSAAAGKGLALRPKSASRTLSGPDAEASSISPIPMLLNDSFLNDSASVRKSSSTSSLQQEADCGTLASLWTSSKWSLKPDFQAISTAVITKPIFDSLQKPIGSRKSTKTAVD